MKPIDEATRPDGARRTLTHEDVTRSARRMSSLAVVLGDDSAIRVVQRPRP